MQIKCIIPICKIEILHISVKQLNVDDFIIKPVISFYIDINNVAIV